MLHSFILLCLFLLPNRLSVCEQKLLVLFPFFSVESKHAYCKKCTQREVKEAGSEKLHLSYLPLWW